MNQHEQDIFCRNADWSKGVIYKTTGRGTEITAKADGKRIFIPRKGFGSGNQYS